MFLLEKTGTHWSGHEWHVQSQEAGYLTEKLLNRKKPQSYDGRMLRILRNDAEQFRLEENFKTPFIVGYCTGVQMLR